MGQVQPLLCSTESGEASPCLRSGLVWMPSLVSTSLPQKRHMLSAHSFQYIEYIELSLDVPANFTSSFPYTVHTLTDN